MFNVFTKCSNKPKTYDIMIHRSIDKSTTNNISKHISKSLDKSYYYDYSPEKYKYCSSDYDGYHLSAVKLNVDWDKVLDDNLDSKNFDRVSREVILEMAKELNPNIIAVIIAKNCYEITWVDLSYYRYHATKPTIYGILNTPAEYISRTGIVPAISTAHNVDIFNNFIKQSIIAGLNDTGIFSEESYSNEPLTQLNAIEQTSSGDIEFCCNINKKFREAINSHLDNCLEDFINNYDNGNLKKTFDKLHLSYDSLKSVCRDVYKHGSSCGEFIFKTDK